KICFDLRLLASGPAAGLGELRLPEVEPGSSIMPGKVNPSVAEAVQMACFQVAANDHAIALAAAAGELELNVMTPLCATNLAESLELLTRATRLLRTRCIAGLRVDRTRVGELLARSRVEATALSPYLGYDVTAEVVKQAQARGVAVRDVVLEHGLMAPRELTRILAPAAPIATFGTITRPENRAMTRILDIDVEEIKGHAIDEYDMVAMVDAQPSFFEEAFGEVDLVIDHHPEETPARAHLRDIRPSWGATSTIMTEYLRAADVKITQRLATALLYGIKTDTLHLERGATKADLEAFAYLHPLANHSALRRIERPELPNEALDVLALGIARRQLTHGVVFSHLGPVAYPELVAQFAEFFLQIEGAEWSVVSGTVNGELPLEDQVRVFRLLTPQQAGAVLAELDDPILRELIGSLDEAEVSRALDRMPSDEVVNVVEELPKEQAEELLDLMEEEKAEEVQELLEYPERTAGRLMSPDFVAVPETVTVARAIEHIRKAKTGDGAFYVYVVDDHDHLVGFVPLHRLITADPAAPIRTIRTEDVESVTVDTEGGIATTQTATVVVRGIALGDLTRSVLWRVLWKEMWLALATGAVSGFALATVAYAWKGNLLLSLILGVALIFNMLVAAV